jgi:hypothetical protein
MDAEYRVLGRGLGHGHHMTLALPVASSAPVGLPEAHRLLLGEGECLLCAVGSDVAAGIQEGKRLERAVTRHREAAKRAVAEGQPAPSPPDFRPRVVVRFSDTLTASVERLLVEVEGDYRYPRTERRRRISRRVAALPELGLSVDEVEYHHRYHRAAVISGIGRAHGARVRRLERELRPRDLGVIHMAARMGAVSVPQARVLMGAVTAQADGKRGRPYERIGAPASSSTAGKLLSRLTSEELLVGLPLGFTPGARREGQAPSVRKAWAITQRAIAVYTALRENELHACRLRPLTDPRAGVGARKLKHDLGVGDHLCSFLAHAQAQPAVRLEAAGQTHDFRLTVSPENWWGAGHLLMACTPPPLIEGDRAQLATTRIVAPDGFCVVGIEGAGLDAALPLLVENDSGVRTCHEVTDQLVGHTELALSGALGKRFPQLGLVGALQQPGGLRPAWTPMLFVTDGRGASSTGEGRMANLARSAAARNASLGYWQPGIVSERPPQYLTTATRVRAHGVLAPVLSLHAPEREEMPLLRAMLSDSRPFLLAAALDHAAVVRMDGAAARANVGIRDARPQRRGDAERDSAREQERRLQVADVLARQRERAAEREADVVS